MTAHPSQTTQLYLLCTEIRLRVRRRFHGPAHKELRCAFGEGLPAAPHKPAAVKRLAEQILSGAAAHNNVLGLVRVHAPTLKRMVRLLCGVSVCQRARRRPEVA